MTVGSQQYSVSTTAVLIGSAPASSQVGPVGALLVLADATVDAYVGGANVSSTNGMKVTHAVTAPVPITLYPGDTVYAITASGTATLGVLQT
jgi:hypothetical protein